VFSALVTSQSSAYSHCSANLHSARRQEFFDGRPTIWNSLPATLQNPNIEFVQFKRLLKAFLFGETAAH